MLKINMTLLSGKKIVLECKEFKTALVDGKIRIFLDNPDVLGGSLMYTVKEYDVTR
jgi:hypothetical protein